MPFVNKQVIAGVKILDFLETIQLEMKTRHISHASLACAMGVKKSQVSKWLSGEDPISAKTIFLLADCIGCNIILARK